MPLSLYFNNIRDTSNDERKEISYFYYPSRFIFELFKPLYMIIVQDTFVCKPGNASKVAKMCKQAFSDNPEVKYVLSDMTGNFNRVIIVSEYESLSAYDKSWEEMQKDPEKMKKMEEIMKGYTEMYLTGSREILRVW